MTRDRHEILNTISHALGIILGIIGLVILLMENRKLTIYSTISIWIYGISIVILYFSSTIYHFFINEKLKKRARILDHMSIFILIAGTYTPICLITLEKTSGWMIFIIVWSIALLGLVMKLFLTGKIDKISLFLYLAMGWFAIFDFNNIIVNMPFNALIFLILGGVLYTLGTIFYAIEKIPYSHFIWHLFVLGGSISHYLMIYCIV